MVDIDSISLKELGNLSVIRYAKEISKNVSLVEPSLIAELTSKEQQLKANRKNIQSIVNKIS